MFVIIGGLQFLPGHETWVVSDTDAGVRVGADEILGVPRCSAIAPENRIG